MELGILFTPPKPSEVAALAQASERAGFSLLALGDSQSLFREAYISLTVAAMSTTSIRIATGVSNLVTRHPAVIASAAATLSEVSTGRFILGLGTGDSSLYNLGLTGVSRQQLSDGVETVRRLLRGETCTFQDHEIHVRWADHHVPVYISAEGPKVLRLAGQIADGVIVGAGLLPEVVRGSLALIEQGAADAGRAMQDIDVWFFAKSNIADTVDEAVQGIKMALAASANHAFRFHRDGKWLPDELKPAVEQLLRRYRPSEHEQIGDTANARLTDELGLTDYLRDRFAVAGTPDTVSDRLEALGEVGVKKLLLAGITPDPAGFVDRWRGEIRVVRKSSDGTFVQ